MCNCINEIENRALEQLKKDSPFPKPVAKVEMQGISFLLTGNNMATRTKQDLAITLEGQKKRPTMPVLHSYCPFCGEKVASA